jgi:hypothetical protein
MVGVRQIFGTAQGQGTANQLIDDTKGQAASYRAPGQQASWQVRVSGMPSLPIIRSLLASKSPVNHPRSSYSERLL